MLGLPYTEDTEKSVKVTPNPVNLCDSPEKVDIPIISFFHEVLAWQNG